jgi:predicted NBD/HSP70 family sugar kinase
MALLGIDLGGTNCRAALADDAGEIRAEATEPTSQARSAEALIEQFWQLARCITAQSSDRSTLTAVGVAVPGFVDVERGLISVLPNLFGNARDIPFRRMLETRFGVPAAIENDVKTAALGELARGWGRDFRNFIFVGIGTGTSAAVITGSRLQRGRSGQAGEIAYALTGREYLGQDFGESGCLETHMSGYGIALQYAKAGGLAANDCINTGAVFERAAAGETLARTAIEAGLDHLAVALSTAVALLDPQALVFGGSIGLRPDVIAGIEGRLTAALPLFKPRIVASQLGKRAQLIGAVENAKALLANAPAG